MIPPHNPNLPRPVAWAATSEKVFGFGFGVAP